MKNLSALISVQFTVFVGFAFIFSSHSEKKIIPVLKYTSIEGLFLKGKINVSVKSLGGYQEKCIQFELKNITLDTVYVHIEAGRRLVCKDSTMQDIFLVKENKIRLLPLEAQQVEGYGFCCNATKHGPSKDVVFDLGYMAPAPWLKLANFINENNFSRDIIQPAVWAISDDRSVATIGNGLDDPSQQLRKMVSKIKGLECPWYTINYEKDEARFVTDVHEMVTARVPYNLSNHGIVSIVVKNSQGGIVKTVLSGQTLGPGAHEYFLDLDVRNWPKGEYMLYIYEDYSLLNSKRKFKL